MADNNTSNNSSNNKNLKKPVKKVHRAVPANQKMQESVESVENQSSSKKKKTGSAGKLKKAKTKRKAKKILIFGFVFFLFAALYFSWIYAFPMFLDNKISSVQVKEFVKEKFDFQTDFSSMNFYTTPNLNIGLQVRDLKLVYPNFPMESEQGLFLSSKNSAFEIQAIPFAMKTIKFDKIEFKSVFVNTYQDSAGEYAYKEHLRSRFMPRLPLYVIEYPKIKLCSYTFDNFNLKTQQSKKEGGALMIIKPSEVKLFLKDADGVNTTTFK